MMLLAEQGRHTMESPAAGHGHMRSQGWVDRRWNHQPPGMDRRENSLDLVDYKEREDDLPAQVKSSDGYIFHHR
jgi:hypothetical protein